MSKAKSKSNTKTAILKPSNLAILAIILSVICVFALRANNEHMSTLRNDVYVADKNNTDVAQSLQNLQAYVTTHMNTSLDSGKGAVYPPIQLKYTYERLLDSESSSAAQSDTSLYTQAQNYCQQEVPVGFSGRYRVPCIEQYVQSHDNSLPTISTSLYEFDFVSPSWSPDLAGWTMLGAILSWLSFIALVIKNRLVGSN